jgi:hypothetical protein
MKRPRPSQQKRDRIVKAVNRDGHSLGVGLERAPVILR